jgi:hypothetical protein
VRQRRRQRDGEAERGLGAGAAGFTHRKEEKHHSFGHDLIGQSFSLKLDRGVDVPRH